MEFFRKPRIRRERIFSLILVIIVLGVLGYLIPKLLEPEILQKLPAGIFRPTKEEIPKETTQKAVEIQEEKREYIEVAERGEGITHLARKVLKKHLQKNPQSFEVTPEHKVYIEDYIAKKLGGEWLKLGETLEFPEDLIKEAIEKAAKLTPEQLENLIQYSQLVPSLNY